MSEKTISRYCPFKDSAPTSYSCWQLGTNNEHLRCSKMLIAPLKTGSKFILCPYANIRMT